MDEKEKEERLKKHKRTKLILKIVGAVLLAAGLGLVITGFVDFFVKLGGDKMEMPTMFWMFFAGFPMLAIGGALLMFGFRSEMASFAATDSVDAIKTVTSTTVTSIKEASEDTEKEDGKFCSSCGQRNKKGANFCNGCGKELDKD